MAKPIPCPSHNGTYRCQLNADHTGKQHRNATSVKFTSDNEVEVVILTWVSPNGGEWRKKTMRV